MACLHRRNCYGILAALCFLAMVGLRAGAENSVAEARMKKDVTFLASDLCEGRGVTTKGINLAADYIAAEFQNSGLKPAGANGTYFQPFTVTGGAALGTPNKLTILGPLGQKIEFMHGEHFE